MIVGDGPRARLQPHMHRISISSFRPDISASCLAIVHIVKGVDQTIAGHGGTEEVDCMSCHLDMKAREVDRTPQVAHPAASASQLEVALAIHRNVSRVNRHARRLERSSS